MSASTPWLQNRVLHLGDTVLYTGSLKDAPSSFQGAPSELALQLLFSKPTSRDQKERAQQLRALVLGEALGSNPRTYTAAHTYL